MLIFSFFRLFNEFYICGNTMDVFLLCLHLVLKPMESQLVTMGNLLANMIAAAQVKRSLLRFGIMVTRDLILTWRI